MAEASLLAASFEASREHLWSVALRVLGSAAEADDAVQETWLRLSGSDVEAVRSLDAWLTTVVARVALDMLRARARRPALELAAEDDARHEPPSGAPDPQDEAVLADSVGAALLVVLDALSPDERLAFVLHETFGVPFQQIGEVLGRSPAAAKQLAHRARHKVRDRQPAPVGDRQRHRAVVDAFLAAAREGRFEALVALLHPDAEVRADPAAVALGAPARTRGAADVAAMFAGRAVAARVVLISGVPGLAWFAGGRPRVVWEVAVADGRVLGMDMLADPDRLAALELAVPG